MKYNQPRKLELPLPRPNSNYFSFSLRVRVSGVLLYVLTSKILVSTCLTIDLIKFMYNYDLFCFCLSNTNTISFVYLLFADGRFCKRKQNLAAVIYGGAEVIRGHNENITMNGSLSYDPETGDNKGMNFTWRYGSITRNNYSSLQLLKQGSFPFVNFSEIQNEGVSFGRIISINSSVANSNQTLVVTLTVNKDYRTSNAIQVIHLVGGDPPKIYQRYETPYFIFISWRL